MVLKKINKLADTQAKRKLCTQTDPLTPTTLHFLRVNAQMRNLTKQKTACSRKPLGAMLRIANKT